MATPLKILMLEDSDIDAEIVQRLLKKENIACEFSLAMTRDAFLHELEVFDADVILADNSLPQFDATEALQMARQRLPHVPFIMVTGTVSEEFAAQIIKKGADDYILKDRLARLPGAIDASLKQRRFEKEKLLVQEKLVESEEKYRTLVEQAFDGIIIYSPGGIMLDFNHSAYTYLGYTKEEFKKLSINDFFFAEDLVKRPIDFERLRVKLSTIDNRRLKKKDGSHIEMEISTKVLPNGNLMAIARDITERRKTEEAIKLSNERYEVVAKATSDALWDHDFITGKTFIPGTGYKDLFGYEQLVNKHSEPLFWESHLHPDDRETVLTKLDKVIADPAVTQSSAEYRFLKADGSYAYISDRFFIIRDNGKPLRMLGAKQDITERKNAEEQLRSSEQKYKLLFEDNPMPLWMFSLKDLRFIAVNESAIQHYGYSKEEFLSMTIKDIRPAEDVIKVRKGLNSKHTGARHSGVWRHKKKDGTVIKVDIIGHDTIFNEERVRLILAIDVTEKLEAEERLHYSYEEIRQLASHLQEVREEERASMAREVHDELGQQLTGLKMDISWLNKKINTTDAVIVEKIKSTMDLLDNAVKTVRKIASELRPSILDDLGLVAALEWQCDIFRKKSSLNINFKGDADEKSIPKHFGIGLFRILQESLTNIGRHSQAKNITVELIVKNLELILTIKDDGVGFVKSNIAGKKTLGLLGMKERSLMMGGSYEIESQPGKGTSVQIVVPL